MTTLFTMNADVKEFVGQKLAGAKDVEFTFDIAVDNWLTVGEPPRHSLLSFQRVVGYTRSDGRMYDIRPVSAAPFDLNNPGNVGVRLLANDPDFGLTSDVSYDVTVSRWVNGSRVLVMQFNTGAVPSTDQAVDLADYAPGPNDTGDRGPSAWPLIAATAVGGHLTFESGDDSAFSVDLPAGTVVDNGDGTLTVVVS